MKTILSTVVAVLAFSNLALGAKFSVSVTVQDQGGQPANGVAVQVGAAPNVPFANNSSLTDVTGTAHFEVDSTESEITDLPITLVATGYPKITYFNQTGVDFTLRLPPPSLEKTADVSGDFVGWNNITMDAGGNATFGLFMPFLSAPQLFAFQVSDLISTQMDTFSILGKPVVVPSNLVLPKQTQMYGIIPISLNKPNFRLPVYTPNTYSFQAVSGQFPFGKVVDALTGGQTIFDVINEMTFQRFGVLTDQTITAPVSGLHMNISQGKILPCIKMDTKNQPTPKVAALVLTRSPELVGKPYQATDIKRVDTGAQNLGCISGDPRPVNALGLSMNYHVEGNFTIFEKGMSSIIARNIPHAAATTNISMKSYFAVPQLTVGGDGTQVASTRPERQGISPTSSAVYAVLSNVVQTQSGDMIVEDVKPQWVVFGNSTLEKIELPTLTAQLVQMDQVNQLKQPAQVSLRRWEYVWLGIDPNFQFDINQLSSVNIGYDLFESMTHASRNAADF